MSGLAARAKAAARAAEQQVEPITTDDFLRFQDFFYRRTGIVFGTAKRYFVDRRLTERVVATGCGSVRAYLQHLRFEDAGSAELQKLVNLMTINETYFYREAYQFECLTRSILPEVVARRPAGSRLPIRIWSLPCSTGEEPYSIALQLIENWPEVDAHNIEIVASDIDTNALRRAQLGIYDERALQHLPAPVRQRYFNTLPEDRWQIIEDLRNSIDFAKVNLADAADMRPHRDRYDVIFCRNLLIYFDDHSRRQAAEGLYDSLRPGGFLCLGHSESMSRISSLLTVRKFPDAIVYQKSDP